jgi:hypothetical protein
MLVTQHTKVEEQHHNRNMSPQYLHTTTDPNTAGYSEHILPTYIINSRN